MNKLTKLSIIPLLISSSSSFSHHQYSNKELVCLTDNIYYEARGESLEGKLMVMEVTLNRSNSNRFPHNLCSVVYQPYQFSWTRNIHHHRLKKSRNNKSYKSIKELVTLNLKSFKPPHKLLTYLFYHNLTVNPAWTKKLNGYQEGNHIFYKF
jgi:spore germination cell wall hydrolase CwlJ-like protein